MSFILKLSGWNCLEVLSDGTSHFVSVTSGSQQYLVKVDAHGIGKIVLHEEKLKQGSVTVENASQVKVTRLMGFRARSLMRKKLKRKKIDVSNAALVEDYLAIFIKANNVRWNLDIEAIMKDSFAYQAHAERWLTFQERGTYQNFTIPCSENPLVSIVIPTYGRMDLVYRLLLSIIMQDDQLVEYEVIVSEDASDHGCDIDEYVSGITLIRNLKNLGFLKNCNQAIAKAKGKYVVLLNNDTYVTKNWLSELLAPFNSDEKSGLVGAKLLYPNGNIQEAGGIVWGNGQPWNVAKGKDSYHCEYSYTRQVDYVSGAVLCIKKQLWDELNGFDECYTPAYYEDTDLAFKVKAAGLKVVYAPLCNVVHDEGQSHGTDTESGVKQYQEINAVCFKETWKTSFKNLGSEGVDLHLKKDRDIKFRVLFIDATTPEPNKNAGSYAAFQEIKLFQSLGGKVTFIPDNLAYWGGYTKDLQRIGVEAIYAPYYHRVEDFIEKRIEEFDLVFITRKEVASRYVDIISSKVPDTPIFFNNADLHFLREFREAVSEDSLNIDSLLLSKKKELAVISKVDKTFVYTREERVALESNFISKEKIFINPWVVDRKKKVSPFEQKGVCFLGGYNHSPNVQAVTWFVDYVMPKIRAKDKTIEFNLYGSNFPKGLQDKFNAIKNVNVIGYCESLDDVFNGNRLFVAPLLSGAGIKGKVLEAISYGMPCVLSEVAVEGIPLIDGLNCSVPKSIDEWCESIVQVYNDEVLLKKYSDACYVLAGENYSFDSARSLYSNVLTEFGITHKAMSL